MPAKKDKKGKKKPGDWSDEEVSSKAAPAIAAKQASDDDEEAPAAKPASRFSFASFGVEGLDDVEDDDGGLMAVAARASAKGKKDKKKAKKQADVIPEDGPGEEDAPVDLASKAPIEMTADQLIEEEFGASKPKGKGKKGKKGKVSQPGDYDEDDFLAQEAAKAMSLNEANQRKPEEVPAAKAPEETQSLAKGDAADDDDHDEGVSKVLSKKEKEKLKKDKEKAKKKAQAAAKKTAGGASSKAEDDEAKSEQTAAAPSTNAAAAEEPAAEADGDDGEEGEGAVGGAAAKNKKKKKKGGAGKVEEPAVKAPAAPAKKVPAHIAAMRAALEKQKALEEEMRRKEEEERKRIEEEEARLAEIERQKEEEKKRKKEKEKAKKEQLKKEGKYMTPKQKQEAAAAQARRDAMLASGQIKVEGLEEEGSAEAPKARKVTYGKKKPSKKTGPVDDSKAETTSAAQSSPRTEEPSIAEDPTRVSDHELEHFKQIQVAANSKPDEEADRGDGDWDADSGDEKLQPATVKDDLDDWDASSASETESSKPAQPTPKVDAEVSGKQPSTNDGPSKPAAKSTAADEPAKVTPVQAKPAAQLPATNGKASKKLAEESEEDSDDDSEDDSDDDSDDEDDDSDSEEEDRVSKAKQLEAQRKAEAAARREQQRLEAIAAGSKDNLRSPICCILGHVDTGKTKLLDKIRSTNVQGGEAGGITQQIGATYFPMDAIKAKTAVLGDDNLKEYKLPGLLVIDTPGHESFTNLRTRGSSLCNIAVLVVDIMHGLEPQTIESIRLLRAGKTPFIVALNKIDRLYGWQKIADNGFQASLAKQEKSVKNEFEKRLKEAMLALAEQGLNAIPYYENKNFAKFVSIVPTSAITGEGVPDMLMLLIKLTQERMSTQLMYIANLECTVIEVKVIEGLGTTIDVVLSNGVMREGDKIVVCGLNGPIVTTVRALLTPQPMKEMRVRGAYVHHKEVKASLGVKIVATDLEKAIAGSRLLVVGPDDDEEDLKDDVMEDLQTIMKSVDKSGKGVYVQASTLGSLEALLEFLRVSKIPVAGINIGDVHKKDIARVAVMLERAPELAVLLAFDVDIDKDAARIAEEIGVKIFKADIIYHLFDNFIAHNKEVLEAKRKDSAPQAVWPCRIKTLKVFAKRDPIILGCDILEGSLRVGTPLAVVKVDPATKHKEIIKLGKITSLEINHKSMEVIEKKNIGAGAAVKIEHASYEPARMAGRHFSETDEIISLISRQSIDTMKELFKDQVSKEDWVLMKKLKPLLDIV